VVDEKRVRLDAFLARAGVGSRSQVRRLIRGGRAAIAGESCKDAGEFVAGRVVTLDGEVVEAPPSCLHLALHKPCGYACSHDPAESPIVDELLPESWLNLGLETVGRLDRDTSGLLILSSEGQLVHRLTHPKHKVAKRYRVEFDGPLASDAVEQCRAGLLLRDSDEATQPAELVVEAEGRATLIVREGRYHQVRRMFAALGARVTALQRDRVGGYDLPEDLAPGEWRRLDDDDLARLRMASNL
jgi:16S rRNA pseudouridine516 synthase